MKKILIIAALASLTGAIGCTRYDNGDQGIIGRRPTAVTTPVPVPTPEVKTPPGVVARTSKFERNGAVAGRTDRRTTRTSTDRTTETTPVVEHSDAATEAYYHYTPPAENEGPMPCYTYTQDNIRVSECPDRFYDNNKEPLTAAPMMEYSKENTYMGYYPDDTKNRDPKAMENRVIDNTNFPGDNLMFLDSKK